MGASPSLVSLLSSILLTWAPFVASSEPQCDYPLRPGEDRTCTSCYYHANNRVWMWVAEHDPPFVPWITSVTLTSTQTLVYMVDPTLGVTTTTTVLPADYISRNFEQEGTRIATITWARTAGQSTTTVVTFPTGFMRWDDEVTWRGNLTVSGTPVIRPSGSVAPIASNPQPQFTSELAPRNASSDPRGSSYQLYQIPETLGLFFKGNEYLFPDQDVIQSCVTDSGGGPLNGAFTELQWATSTTTSFVDLGAPNSTTSAEPGRTPGLAGPGATGGSTTSESTGPSQTPDSAGPKSKGSTNVSLLLGSLAAFITCYW